MPAGVGARRVGGRPPFNPLSLFAGGALGFLFDSLGPSYAFTDAGTTPVSIAGDLVQQLNDRSPNALNATQATLGKRPQWQPDRAPYLLFDATDDVLTTTLAPVTTGMTIAACFRDTGNSVAVHDAVGVRATASTRLQLGKQSTSGVLQACYGSLSGVILDTAGGDITNIDVVGLLRGNATTVDLFRNGVLAYTGASAGSPTTANAIYIGARNNAGVADDFLPGRVYRAFAIQTFLADKDVAPLMRWLGEGVLAF